MRRTAWIWLAGCIAWTLDGMVEVHARHVAKAELGFGVALMFLIAWMFYRQETR